jgi:hypothetical protein
MLKRKVTALFFVTIFAIGVLSCVNKSMARGDRYDTEEGNYKGIHRDASVPSSKRVVLQNSPDPESNIEYCIDYDPKTGCPYPKRAPYECAKTKNKLKIDPDFVIGSKNSTTDPKGPTTPTFIGDINSDMRCPVIKAAHNPCQWIILAGRAYGPFCWQ